MSDPIEQARRAALLGVPDVRSICAGFGVRLNADDARALAPALADYCQQAAGLLEARVVHDPVEAPALDWDA